VCHRIVTTDRTLVGVTPANEHIRCLLFVRFQHELALSHFAVGLLFLACSTGRPQDALRNTLATERNLPSQQLLPYTLPAEQPHVGPVQFTLGLYSRVDFNDNINTAQAGAQSDAIFRAGTTLGLLWPATERSDLQLNASVGYVHYLTYSQFDGWELAPNSALSWNIAFPDGAVTLFDQFSYSRDVIPESSLSGLVIFPRFENTAGLRGQWYPGSLDLEAGYSHDNFFSGSAQFEYLNRASEFFFVRAGWRFGEKSQTGLEASAGITGYQKSIQSDNTSISIGPYLEWQVTSNLLAQLRGGPTFYLFEPSTATTHQNNQLNSYYLSLDISDRLTDFLSQSLEVRHDVQLGLNQGSDYVEQWSANYWFNLSITRRLTLSARLTYENGSQPFEVPIYLPFEVILLNLRESFERFGVGPELSWQFTDKFVARLGYSYWKRTSSLPDRGYNQNDVLMRLEYTF